MKRAILLGILLYSTIIFGLDFRTALDVACGGDAATAMIGVSPDARNGLDAYDMPYFGFPPAFALYFSTTDSGLALNLTNDVRNALDSIQIWNGTTVMETGSDVVIRWDTTSFPADSGELKIGYFLPGDTVTEWFDMTEIDSIAYPVGNRIQIVLKHEVSTFEDSIPPEILSWSIAPEETIYDSTMVLSVTVIDTGSGVDSGSVSMKLNSIPISLFVNDSTIGDTVIFSYTPFLSYRDVNTVIFSVSDFAGNTVSDSFVFYYSDSTDTSSGYVISGMVMLAGGTTTLSGTKVMISELGLTDTTGTMGQFSMPPVPSDTYTVIFDRVDYIPIDTVIYLVSDTTIMVTLESSGGEGIEVSGQVTLEGETDFSNSIVFLNTFSLGILYDTTDATGNYDFLLPSPGFFTLGAEHDGFITDSTLVVALGDTIVNFELESASIAESEKFDSQISLTIVSNGSDGILFRCANAKNLSIYDILGRQMQILPVSDKGDVYWNLSDNRGSTVPAGFYFVRASGKNGITKNVEIVVVK